MTWAASLYHAFNEFIDSGRWLKALFFVGGIMLVSILIRIQRGDNRVDFKDLLVEDGHTSPRRVFAVGAFLAHTWVLMVLANNNQLQEWYFNGYAACWILNGLGQKWLDGLKDKPPPPPTPTRVAVEAAPGTPINLGTVAPPAPADPAQPNAP